MIDFKNLFLVSICFGMSKEEYIIIANDEDHAIYTIKEAFFEPDILYLLSFKKINDLIDRIRENNTEFHFVIVVDSAIQQDEDGILVEEFIFNEYEEWGLDTSLILKKYSSQKALVLDRKEVYVMCEKIYTYLENKDIQTLISEEVQI